MKMLVYNLRQSENENGVVLSEVHLQWSQANEVIAKKEAYLGIYRIEQMTVDSLAAQPTQLDRVEAQAVYTAMMTDTLLEE